MPARFIADSDLNAALEGIFKDARRQLILISPYIKLHDRLQAILKTRLSDPELFIQVVFGKNEEDPKRSMRKEDLDFFMQFPNIELRYERRLHAKYYTNDSSALITSMNLYSYSQDNNIESGILTSVTALSGLADRLTRSESLDEQAVHYFGRVVEQATLIFKREPEYERAMFGLARKYTVSNTSVNKVQEFFSGRTSSERVAPTVPPIVSTFSPPVPVSSHTAYEASKPSAFCIRTGVPIPFNVKRPLCEEAYRSWSRYQDEHYTEKFCHFSGEPSHGETSYAKPILWKHWAKAKATHGL